MLKKLLIVINVSNPSICMTLFKRTPHNQTVDISQNKHARIYVYENSVVIKYDNQVVWRRAFSSEKQKFKRIIEAKDITGNNNVY